MRLIYLFIEVNEVNDTYCLTRLRVFHPKIITGNWVEPRGPLGTAQVRGQRGRHVVYTIVDEKSLNGSKSRRRLSVPLWLLFTLLPKIGVRFPVKSPWEFLFLYSKIWILYEYPMIQYEDIVGEITVWHTREGMGL